MEGEQKQQLHRGAGPGSLPRAAAARSSARGGGSPRGRRCSLLPSPPWRGLPVGRGAKAAPGWDAGCRLARALPTARQERGIGAPAARRAPAPRDSHTQCSHA